VGSEQEEATNRRMTTTSEMMDMARGNISATSKENLRSVEIPVAVNSTHRRNPEIG